MAHDAVVWGPGVHRAEVEWEIGRVWGAFFNRGGEGDAQGAVPETIASQCCAQFAVTREAVQRHGVEVYVRMRNWLMRTTLGDDVSGRVFEKLWAYIFTGEAVQ